MPKKTIYEGSVPRYEVLAADGSLDEELAAPVWDVLTDEAVAAAYEEMLRGRALDDAAYRLQRSGRMGTFPQNRGQEAAALGAAMALRKGHDRLVPSYRENGALIHLGVPAEQVLLHWMGDERGNAFDPTLAVSPTCISIGAQILHGAGVAWALKLQDADRDEADRRVAMTIFGDGATSQGDFHEGLNFASTLNAPAVFVCQNNGWAISVPTHKQTASETFAQKALGFGMVGVQADGNDLFASLLACREAVDRARAGEGATLIELTTYRLADHTTADDARRPASWRRPSRTTRSSARVASSNDGSIGRKSATSTPSRPPRNGRRRRSRRRTASPSRTSATASTTSSPKCRPSWSGNAPPAAPAAWAKPRGRRRCGPIASPP